MKPKGKRRPNRITQEEKAKRDKAMRADKDAGMTCKEICAKYGVSQSTVSIVCVRDVEAGKSIYDVVGMANEISEGIVNKFKDEINKTPVRAVSPISGDIKTARLLFEIDGIAYVITDIKFEVKQ